MKHTSFFNYESHLFIEKYIQVIDFHSDETYQITLYLSLGILSMVFCYFAFFLWKSQFGNQGAGGWIGLGDWTWKIFFRFFCGKLLWIGQKFVILKKQLTGRLDLSTFPLDKRRIFFLFSWFFWDNSFVLCLKCGIFLVLVAPDSFFMKKTFLFCCTQTYNFFPNTTYG